MHDNGSAPIPVVCGHRSEVLAVAGVDGICNRLHVVRGIVGVINKGGYAVIGRDQPVARVPRVGVRPVGESVAARVVAHCVLSPIPQSEGSGGTLTLDCDSHRDCGRPQVSQHSALALRLNFLFQFLYFLF